MDKVLVNIDRFFLQSGPGDATLLRTGVEGGQGQVGRGAGGERGRWGEGQVGRGAGTGSAVCVGRRQRGRWRSGGLGRWGGELGGPGGEGQVEGAEGGGAGGGGGGGGGRGGQRAAVQRGRRRRWGGQAPAPCDPYRGSSQGAGESLLRHVWGHDRFSVFGGGNVLPLLCDGVDGRLKAQADGGRGGGGQGSRAEQGEVLVMGEDAVACSRWSRRCWWPPEWSWVSRVVRQQARLGLRAAERTSPACPLLWLKGCSTSAAWSARGATHTNGKGLCDVIEMILKRLPARLSSSVICTRSAMGLCRAKRRVTHYSMSSYIT